MNHSDNQSTKCSYHKPEFRLYGNIQSLTQAVGPIGMKDSGAGTNDMTQA